MGAKMELSTLVDRSGYRWQTLPEPALVHVTIANAGLGYATGIELRVACSGAMRHVHQLGAAAGKAANIQLDLPDLGPGQEQAIVLEFVSLPAAKAGTRSIGTLTLRWREDESIHQIGAIVSAQVLAAGSAQRMRHPKIAQVIAARRGSTPNQSLHGTMSRT